MSSRISGFYNLSIDERTDYLKKLLNLTKEEIEILRLTKTTVTIENPIGVTTIPLGIATNFKINGHDKLIPFAVEEASVVAAASKAAKIARIHGGFSTQNSGSIMIGQVQLVNVKDITQAIQNINNKKNELIKILNNPSYSIVKYGGGVIDIETRIINNKSIKMLVVHLIIDCLDAMGANAVNRFVESSGHYLEEITGGVARLKILSNLADRRTVKVTAVFDKDMLGGEEIINKIVDANEFAKLDPYRAATHNKGIMNAISSIGLATSNDTRALEAGAHAYAARNGQYSSLTEYYKTKDGHLKGILELPLAVGIIGGATKIHPPAQICLKILKVNSALELAEIMAAAGLAQNVAALHALCTEGIQKGHMRLHSKNLDKWKNKV